MMNQNITYREYAPTDIRNVRDILEADLGYVVPLDELADRVREMNSDNNYKILVACEGEEVIGFAGMVSYIVFERKDKVAKIIALAVSKQYRGKGIGTNLLEKVEHYCISHNIGVLLLNSGLVRDNAHKFYESKGYSKKSYGFVKQLK